MSQNHPEIFKAVKNKSDGGELIYCKSRVVDPWLLKGGELYRLSEIDKTCGQVVRQDLGPKKYYFKITDKL